ncbi:MAG: hypothetical protein RIF41_07585 [Polyangiaceae bacterium]
MDPSTREKAQQAIVDSIDNKLAFNLAAYGKAWTLWRLRGSRSSKVRAGGDHDTTKETG